VANHLSIAAVTATLKDVLQGPAEDSVTGALVTALNPDEDGMPDRGVNIFLYQVEHNSSLRNEDLMTRSSNGGLLQKPKVALDLHYLFSFYGSGVTYEPQRLLGVTTRELHAKPFLERDRIRDTVADITELVESNLADELELVKFSPLPLNLEELSKLWSIFFQKTYNLSVAYSASVVIIETDDEVQSGKPVRERNIYTIPLQPPHIDSVAADAGPDVAITAGSDISITGRHLKGEQTVVKINGEELIPGQVLANKVVVTLPGDLLAGVNVVQIVHYLNMGTPALPHRGFESNAKAFMLQPRIVQGPGDIYQITVDNVTGSGPDPRDADISVNVEPLVIPRQKVFLELLQNSVVVFRFAAEERETDTSTLDTHVVGVDAGSYIVRLRIDDAESPVEIDTNPMSPTYLQAIEPAIVIP